MSVAVPIINSIDGNLRRIYLNQGVSDFYPIEDIYHEYRNRRRLDTDEIRKYSPLLKAEGNVPKGAGAFTPRYVVLLEGTKIVPFDESLQLNQLGDMITDDPDVDATLYDISGLTTAKPIFIKPSEAETIQLNSSSIEFSSYNNQVTVDFYNITGKASAGTKHPIGTRQKPVDNLVDAYSIAESVGLNEIRFLGNLPITVGNNFEGYQFVGDSPTKSTVTIDPIADILNCEFENCTISGTLDGNAEILHCRISDLEFVDGKVSNSDIGPGIIKLGTSTNANIFSCFSTVPGNNTPVIDMNGTGILGLRDYDGGIELRNYNGNSAHSIDMSSGQIKLDPNTITSGTFICRGIGKLVDASTSLPIKTGTWNGGVSIVNEMINLTTIGEAADYSTAIYIDAINGRSGITDPIGLARDPVNNLVDAVVLANRRGTSKLFFLEDYTFLATDSIVGFEIIGQGEQFTKLTFIAGCITAYCDAHDLTLTGNLTGITGMNDCSIIDLGSVGLAPSAQDLIVRRCKFKGTTTLPSNYSGNVTLLHSYTDIAVTSYPIFDAGNFTGNMLMDNFSGQVLIKNLSQGNDIDIRLSQGEIILDDLTVTNANIHIVGTGKLLDKNHNEIPTGLWNGGVTIDNETITGSGSGSSVWTTGEKDNVLAWSRKASDNAEEVNLKIQ